MQENPLVFALAICAVVALMAVGGVQRWYREKKRRKSTGDNVEEHTDESQSKLLIAQFLQLLLAFRIAMPITEQIVYPPYKSCNAYFICPHCKMPMRCDYINFCNHCGQCLDWRKSRKAQPIYVGR